MLSQCTLGAYGENMRILWPILVVLGCAIMAKADSFELVGGGLTYHLCCDATVSQQFRTKLADQGRLIFNPLSGMRYNSEDSGIYRSVALFAGQNSLGYNIDGAILAIGADLDFTQIGLVVGGYLQDSKEFSRRKIPLASGDFMPMLGAEVNFVLYRHEQFYIKENNLLTFFMTNHTLSAGWDL